MRFCCLMVHYSLEDGSFRSVSWPQELFTLDRSNCSGSVGGIKPAKHTREVCLPRFTALNKGNLVDFDALKKVIGVGSQTPDITLEDVDSFWSGVVKGFSSCDLTKEEDRLVAISGLARKIQERHQQIDFVAGMLRQSLHTGLLWEVAKDRQARPVSRPTTYRAPSWSWASVNAPIRPWALNNDEQLSRIIDTSVEPGDDPVGQNVSATLRIEGYLMTVGVRIIQTEEEESLGLRINGVWYEQPRPQTLQVIQDVDEPFRNLHCLVIEDYRRGEKSRWMVWCLFIQPTGAKRGQFRSYGRHIIRSKDYNFREPSDLKDVRNEEWLEFESVGSDGKYIISIV